MTDRTVRVILSAEDRGLTSTMAKAATSATTLAGATEKATRSAASLGGSGSRLAGMGASLDRLASSAAKYEKAIHAAGVAGVAGGVAVGAMAAKYAAFDAQMSKVEANADVTGATLNRLRETAIKLGGDTQYSAGEAAAGINEMAKAGASAGDIINSGLKGALDLAAAGQLSVAEAAETAGIAMVQFKLAGKDIPHIADLLASGAASAAGEVRDMAMALKQTGQVASQAGLSLDETVAGLTAFASAGLVGSDAGTSFKTMLMRLTPSSKEAANEMADLGLKAYDQQGRFVGLAEFAGRLQQSMRGLSDEQRQAAMTTIFGSDAIRAANVLYEQGADGIRKWTAEVSKQGEAGRMAATYMNNLSGDLERLSGSFDTIVMRSGGGVNNALRGLAQAADAVLNTVGNLPRPVLETGAGLGALAAAATLASTAGLTLAAKWVAVKAALDAGTVSAARLGVALRAVGIAAGVGAAAFVAVELSRMAGAATVTTVDVDRLADSLSQMGREGKSAFTEIMSARVSWGPFGQEIRSTSDALREFGEIAGAATQTGLPRLFNDVLAGGQVQAGKLDAQVRQLDASLAAMVESGRADQAKAAFDRLLGAAQAEGANMDELRPKFEAYQAAVDDAANGSARLAEKQTVAAAAAAGMSVEEYKLVKSAEDAQKATEAFHKAVRDLGTTLLGQRDAARGYEAALDAADAALKSNGKTLDIHTEKGRANQEALDGVAKAGVAAAAAILDNGGSIQEAGKRVAVAREDFVRMAEKMGMSRQAARGLANDLGLTKDKVQELANASSRLKPIRITADVAQALTAIGRVGSALGNLPGLGVLGLATTGLTRTRAQGGVLPGWTPGRDVHWFTSPTGGRLGLSGGEAVMRPEWTRAVGAARVDAWNRAASTGGTGAVRSAMGLASGGIIGGSYASGGQVGEIKITGQGIVLPMRAAVKVQWSESDLQALTVDLMETLTGIKQDVPESVRKVRDDWDKIRAVIRGSVEDSSKLAESLRDAQAKITTTGTSSGSAVSGAKVSYSGALGSAKAKPYREAIIAAGIKYGVAPELLAAQIQQESGWNPRAVSSAGAKGLAQFMPGTARSVGLSNPFDPFASITAQAKLMGEYARKYAGDITKMLAAYNAGPGNVSRWTRISETRNYVNRIGRDAGVAQLSSGRASKASTAAASVSSDLALQMIANAKLAIGNMYRYGGGHGGANQKTDLRKALVDCSGLLNVSLSKVLNRNVSQVSDDFLKGKNAKQLSVGQALKTAGAFVGRVGSGKNGHVAISLGDGTILEAPRTGLPVRIRKTTAKEWNAAAWDLRLGSPTTSSRGSSGGGSVGSDMDSARRLAEAIADRDAARLAVEANQLRAEQRDRLLAVLERQQPAMERLALAREDTEKRLAEATQSLADLEKEAAAYAASVADKATGRGSLVGMFRDGDSTRTWTQAAAGMRIVIDETRKFAGSIQDLKALGLDDALLRQVVDAGVVDGQAIAKSIQDGGQLAVDELNQLSDDLGLAGKGLGQTTVDTLYQSGIDGAKGLVKGLQDTLTGQQDQIRRIGEFIAAQIWSGYGLTGPTGTVRGLLDQRVKTGLGGGGTVKIASPNVTVQVTLDGKQLDARTRVQVEQAIRPAVEAALVGAR